MEKSSGGLKVYKAVNVNRIYYANYIDLPARTQISLPQSPCTMIYCDEGRVDYRSLSEVCRVEKGENAFVCQGGDRSISCGINSKALVVGFDGGDDLISTKIAVDSGIKAILSKLMAYSENVFGRSVYDIPSADEKMLPSAFSGSLQGVATCVEILFIESLKPAYKPFKANFENEYFTSQGRKVAEKIIAILNARKGEKITVDDIANELFFSPSYVKSVFFRYTGKTITEAKTEIRINSAKDMLSKGAKISDVAISLGYSSISHFCSSFKKATGLTPTEFINSI